MDLVVIWAALHYFFLTPQLVLISDKNIKCYFGRVFCNQMYNIHENSIKLGKLAVIACGELILLGN